MWEESVAGVLRSGSRNRGAKGNQFQAIEAVAIGVNHWQVDVRVAGGIAMSWKVFRGGQATVFFHTAHKGGHVFGHARRIFSEGSCIDNRIAWIVVYIGVRSVNPLNADGAGFQRRNFSHGVGVSGIACGGKRHRGGERSAFIQTHSRAAFEICANQ
jgi:hypothetical protein